MTIRTTTLSKPLSSHWEQKKTRVYRLIGRDYMAIQQRFFRNIPIQQFSYYCAGVFLPYFDGMLEFPVKEFKDGKVMIHFQSNWGTKGPTPDNMNKINIWSKQFVKIPWQTNPNDSTHKVCQFIEQVLDEAMANGSIE